MKKLPLILSAIIAFPTVSWAHCSDWDVIDADNRWKEAIDSNVAQNVVDLYEENGVLLPTFGVTIIDNQVERLKYFKKLFSEIDDLSVHFQGDRHIQFVDGGAISSGDYEFRGHVDSEEVETPARYTFVYQQIKHEDDLDGCKLQLITHHSSEQPFGSKITQLMLQ